MTDHEDYLPGEAPAAHHESHEDGESDEINIAGLTGISAYMAAHILLANVHHDKYTDAESRAAINDIFGADGKADAPIYLEGYRLINVLDPVADQDGDTKKGRDDAISTHSALPTVHQDAPALILTHKGDASAHHAKYTDAEARAAVYASLPAFHSYVTPDQLNVTGDATVYSITGAIWSDIYDNLSNFLNGTFTAPITGLYLLSVNLWLTGVGAAHTTGQFEIVTSNRAYTVSYQNYANLQAGGNIFIPFSLIVDMDVDDTAFLRLTVFSGAKTVDVKATSFFSGALVYR